MLYEVITLDAQEAGALLEGLGSETRHLEQGLAIRERALFVPPGDDA